MPCPTNLCIIINSFYKSTPHAVRYTHTIRDSDKNSKRFDKLENFEAINNKTLSLVFFLCQVNTVFNLQISPVLIKFCAL